MKKLITLLFCGAFALSLTSVNAQNILRRDIYLITKNSSPIGISPLSNDSISSYFPQTVSVGFIKSSGLGTITQSSFIATNKFDSIFYTPPQTSSTGVDSMFYTVFDSISLKIDTQFIYIFLGISPCNYLKDYSIKRNFIQFGEKMQNNILTISDSLYHQFGSYPFTNDYGFFGCQHFYDSSYLLDSFGVQQFYYKQYSTQSFSSSYSSIFNIKTGTYTYSNINAIRFTNFHYSTDTLVCYDTSSFLVNVSPLSAHTFDDNFLVTTAQTIDTLKIFDNDLPTFNFIAQYSTVAAPVHGSVQQGVNGVYYQPAINFTGLDSFKYSTCYTIGNNTICDSAVVKISVICSDKTVHLSATVCDSVGYLFGNKIQRLTGIYHDTTQSAAGCDSISILNLTILNSTVINIPVKICYNQYYKIYNDSFTTSIVKDYKFNNYIGCDSTRKLILTVIPHYGAVLHQQICSNSFYNFNGTLLNNAGTYFDTLLNSLGCDSIVTLHLTVVPSNSTTINFTTCSGHPYYFGNQTLNNSGTYIDTFINHFGCDSIITLNLTVLNNSHKIINANSCQGVGYAFHSSLIYNSGIYFDTTLNFLGCDSVNELHLNIVAPSYGSYNDFICNGSTYNFNGTLINQPGTYIDTILSYTGCDSIVTLNLSLRYSSASTIYDTICSNSFYNLNGHLYNQNGIFKDTIPNAVGCDSVITLHLKVHNFSLKSIFGQICANKFYNFRGRLLNQAGNYYDTITNHFGCDSFITLNLVVYPLEIKLVNTRTCFGHPYVINNMSFNAPGVYIIDTLQAINGGISCDTIFKINLAVDHPDTSVTHHGDTLTVNGATSSYNWIDCTTKQILTHQMHRNFIPTVSGDYQIVINLNGCLDTGSCYHVIVTGVEQISGNYNFVLFPNPADDEIQFNSNNNSLDRIKIYDLSGHLLIDEKIMNHLQVIHVNQLPNGLYQVELIDDKHQSAYQKLSIIHH